MLTVRLKFILYLFGVVIGFHQVHADITWLSGDFALWAWNCDFAGSDISNTRSDGASCSAICFRTSGCTHFTWTNYNGGTCWLKSRNGIDGRSAIYNSSPWSVCGLRRSNWQIPIVPFMPIFFFDTKAPDYCLPDWPSSATNKVCRTSFHPNMPVFVETSVCNFENVYTFWLWYGWQKECIELFGGAGDHDNDWEHVSVFVKDGRVTKVRFHQHNGHYTRRAGTYQTEGQRPKIFIGKVAHGSYHAPCDGKCDFSEIFKGCLGSVNYCQGGCGYWDDFRNPGFAISNYVLHEMRAGQTFDGIQRPDRPICALPSCAGSGARLLASAGCWQDEP